ncbi:glutamyl-tRNA reductase [Marinicella rhabdoformis]|uniref:glutamyl-tRNA reductase n=1 Tax=Marinicella rhabdoformis TaxID=2580566 RepID=UPI0012AEB810|nr:glutamyl-tRNA reductase [Marinicella rhabdoformis]
MPICVIGINHKTATTAEREGFTVAESEYKNTIEQLCNHPNIDAAAVVSTCNRTEFYLSLVKLNNWQNTAKEALSIDLASKAFYHYLDAACAAHLFTVTAGVDSLVLGETQIQGQVKRAFESSHSVTQNSEFHQLYQMALKTAKAVRSDTEIGKNPVSVAHCSVQLSRQIFGDLAQQNVLIIGAGETAELIMRYLINHGAQKITVANRTHSKAEKLASFFDKESHSLNDLPQLLPQNDLVFTATASPVALVTRNQTEQAIKQRKHKPMVMIDLSVPRDIEPSIKSMDDVFLYTVDDLQQVITENMNKRESMVESAKRIIDAEAELFAQWQKRQRHHDLLKQLQQRVTADKEQLLAKHLPKDLSQHHQQKIETMAHQLSKKHSHHSITALRKVIESGNEDHIKLMAEVFDLSMNNTK